MEKTNLEKQSSKSPKRSSKDLEKLGEVKKPEARKEPQARTALNEALGKKAEGKGILNYLKQSKEGKYIEQIQKIAKYTKKISQVLGPLLKKYSQSLLAKGFSFYKHPISKLKLLQKAFTKGFQKTDAYLRELMQTPQNTFHLFLTFIVIGFIALNLLSASNPFHLFLPPLSFPIPPREERKLLTFYALSREKASLIAMQHYLLVNDSIELRLRLIGSLVAEPLHSKIRPGQSYSDLQVLPLLGNSIRRVWQAYTEHLIIDLSKDALEYEMELFHRALDNSQKKSYYRDAFFLAFSASIFETERDVKSLEFWLDGKPLDLSQIDFPSGKKLTRNSLLPYFTEPLKK